MLPIVLVLLVATTALAAPSALVNIQPIQETSVPYDTGYGMTRSLATQLLQLYDQADTTLYVQIMEQIVQDVASNADSYSQALAVSQILAILGQIAYGVPGNNCAAANAINGSGSYVPSLVNAIDAVAALSSNPASLRNSQPAGSCSSGGNNYQFEAAWSNILNAASPYTLPLVNEEYCAAKRLYQAFSLSSNSVAAAITAASLPSTVQAVQQSINPLLNFLRACANGNGYSLAGQAKQALQNCY